LAQAKSSNLTWISKKPFPTDRLPWIALTQSKYLRFGVLLVFCAALFACQTVATTRPPLPIPSPTVLLPTSVPPVRVVSHHVSQGPTPGEWQVLGFVENQSDSPIGQVRLRVSLMDAAGEVIESQSASSLMSNLLPGEFSPFSVSFDSAVAPAGAQVEISSQEPANGSTIDGQESDQRPELVSELKEFFVTASGELAIMGLITNPGNTHIALDSLGFLGRAPDDSVKSIAVMQFGPAQLAPGETAPFLALAPENPGAVQWIPFHDGLVAEPPRSSSMEIRGEPELHLTAQGAPFVVGTLMNTGQVAAGSVLISLFDGNRLIGLWEVKTPRPLEVGEQLPFVAFGFPGISPRIDPGDPEAIRVEARVEQSAPDAARELIDLPVDVSTFLSVGSAIFIRGTIHNPMAFDVDAATVYAEVRSSTGELVTAGWSAPENLVAGASVDFVLDLPIPVGMDATLSEYDLRAIGLRAES
jgi:hypothetical protein